MSAEAKAQAELILAVDAGGSKAAACFARPTSASEFHVLGRGRSGGANPLSIGVERAVESILAAVGEARRESQLADAVADRAVLSIAGAADRAVAAQIATQLHDAQVARRIAIVSDVLPILAIAAEGGTGIALIAGTGSVAIGRHAGRQVRCGGWGYLLGDEGSGYAIGRAALQAALANLEAGVAKSPGLVQTIVDHLRVTTPTELTKSIYGAASPRFAIAALAERVVQSAAAGDRLAKQILNHAAGDLATLVMRAAAQLSLETSEIPLTLSGGVLVASPELRDALQEHLQMLKLNCRVQVATDPLTGCLKLSRPEAKDGYGVEWS
jgi:glucosamine kinase